MKPYGEGKEYGRMYSEAQAARARARRDLIITKEKQEQHDRAVSISNHKQAKIFGMGYEEYIKMIGVN